MSCLTFIFSIYWSFIMHTSTTTRQYITVSVPIVWPPLCDVTKHLDERSSSGAAQHRHLAGVDSVGPVLAGVVHAQDAVQHLLLVAVAGGRNHAVGA